MAADAPTDDLPCQRPRRAVVRTAGAVVGLAHHKRIVVASAYGLQDRQARRNAWCLPEALQPWPEPFNDHVSITFSMHRKKGRVMLVVLTQHTRMLRHIVEAVTQLRPHKRALFLNHNNLFQTRGKAPHHLSIKGIDDPQAQDPDAQAL